MRCWQRGLSGEQRLERLRERERASTLAGLGVQRDYERKKKERRREAEEEEEKGGEANSAEEKPEKEKKLGF